MPERKHPVHQPLHIGDRAPLVFVTVCAKDRRPILACDSFHTALVDAWEADTDYLVGRYVILPDHVHFFCAPSSWEPPELKEWVGAWKGRASFNWKDKPGRGFWQEDFWDSKLRSGESYDSKWEYVRSNPVRHGLVANEDDWRFRGELNILPWD